MHIEADEDLYPLPISFFNMNIITTVSVTYQIHTGYQSNYKHPLSFLTCMSNKWHSDYLLFCQYDRLKLGHNLRPTRHSAKHRTVQGDPSGDTETLLPISIQPSGTRLHVTPSLLIIWDRDITKANCSMVNNWNTLSLCLEMEFFFWLDNALHSSDKNRMKKIVSDGKWKKC